MLNGHALLWKACLILTLAAPSAIILRFLAFCLRRTWKTLLYNFLSSFRYKAYSWVFSFIFFEAQYCLTFICCLTEGSIHQLVAVNVTMTLRTMFTFCAMSS